jgi:hypothetical protein
MARKPDMISLALVLLSAAGFAHGLWTLAGPSELPGLYWIVASGLGLQVASERERFLAAR